MNKALSLLQQERERIDVELKGILNSLAVAQQSLDFVKEQQIEAVSLLHDLQTAIFVLKTQESDIK